MGRAAFGAAIANLCRSDDQRLHFPTRCLAKFCNGCGGLNCPIESGLDYAKGKKHNVVVKKPDAMDPVETGVLQMADDLNRYFGEGLFADATLRVLGTISNTKRQPPIVYSSSPAWLRSTRGWIQTHLASELAVRWNCEAAACCSFRRFTTPGKSGRGGKGHEI
jgi:hypothetical protein